jgi:hypothetical protein
MAHEETASGGLERPFIDARPALITGFAAAGIAWLMAVVLPDTAVPLRVLSLTIGLLGAGVAAAIALGTAWNSDGGRRRGAAVLALAGVAGVVAEGGFNKEWDMAVLTLWISVGLALGGAVVLLLPRTLRRLVASAFVIFHFGGIVTAVTMVPATDGSSPWLSSQLWAYIYRPYLQYTWLANGYHFYSPEPGPTELLYFRIAYADGTARWVRVPERAENNGSLKARRLGSLATGTSQTVPQNNLPPETVTRRNQAGREHKPPIPMAPGDVNSQYREPTLQGRRLIESYVRHLARTRPHPTDPSQPITGIKVYLVEYWFPSPEELNEGMDPLDPTLYLAFYQGDFEPTGQMKTSCQQIEFNEAGGMVRKTQDPFLYWLIPILRDEEDTAPSKTAATSGPSIRQPYHGSTRPPRNYVLIHAGDKEDTSW